MESRRTFIKKASKGVVLSSLAFSSSVTLAKQIIHEESNNDKPIRIGIIGAGSVGANLALLLAKSGFEVLLFEKNIKKS